MRQNKDKHYLNGDVNEHEIMGNNLVVVETNLDSGYSNSNTVEIPLEDLNESKNNEKDVPPVIPPRQTWDHPIEFLLSCIAMSVGLGNVWRFPYVAFKNGGGAFLIPYILVLFFIGKPVYFLEMCMGQFCSKGPCKLWQMVPFFKGVGYGATFATACVLSFYCALMAITVFYLFQSFSSELPWNLCNPVWDIKNFTCLGDKTAIINGANRTIPELYFQYEVYHEPDNIDDGIGSPDWRLALCLLCAWIAIFASLIKGVQSAGKVAYFTALFPYLILFIFLIRGLTLHGAWDGIFYFINPQWHKLLEGQVWIEATKQCFFSMSIGFGPLITFASFNPFNHPIYKDVLIVSIMDTFTSLLAGFTTFACLGHLAYLSNSTVENVASRGPGLAFVSIPKIVSSFPLPQLFSVLFFLMLFTLGIGSATSLAGGVITVIHDKFTTIDKKLITIGVSIFGFISGLLYITPGGLWMLNLVDYFGAGSIIYIITVLELIGIIFVYGLPNVVRDIEFMLGRKISLYWQICWVTTPVILMAAFIYEQATGEAFSYDKDKFYPTIAVVFGWLLVATAILILFLFAFHGIFQQDSKEGFLNKLSNSFKPLKEWGPLDPEDRKRWEEHKQVHARRPSLAGKFFIKN